MDRTGFRRSKSENRRCYANMMDEVLLLETLAKISFDIEFLKWIETR